LPLRGAKVRKATGTIFVVYGTSSGKDYTFNARSELHRDTWIKAISAVSAGI